jgi:putative oxidoreductase
MTNLNQCKEWMRTHGDVFMDLVRIYLGVGLFFKGVSFMFNREYLIGLMDRVDNLWFAPAAAAHIIIPAHIAGGILLALGLLTRFAAILQIPVVLGAIFYLYMPRMMQIEYRQNLEFSMLVLFLLVLMAIFGAGRWSLDHLLMRRSEAKPAPAPQAA